MVSYTAWMICQNRLSAGGIKWLNIQQSAVEIKLPLATYDDDVLCIFKKNFYFIRGTRFSYEQK